MLGNHITETSISMKLLVTSFVSGVYSIFAFASISQTDVIAWSATLTTVISGVSLCVMHIWTTWRQKNREEELKDKDICQAKLDEAIARIRGLSISVEELKDQAKELKDQSDRWENIAKTQNIKLNTVSTTVTNVAKEVKEINSGLKANE